MPILSDDQLQESILNDPYPQVCECDGSVIPRAHSIISLHKDSLRHKLHGLSTEHPTIKRHKNRSKIGDEVHTYLCAKNRGVSLPEIQLPDTHAYLQAYERWNQDAGLKTHLFTPDQRIASLRLGFAGTPDLVTQIKGENWLIDYKIASEMEIVNYIQLAAYTLLLVEIGITIHRTGLLLLGSTRSLSLREPYNKPRHRDVFLELKDKWYTLFPNPSVLLKKTNCSED